MSLAPALDVASAIATRVWSEGGRLEAALYTDEGKAYAHLDAADRALVIDVLAHAEGLSPDAVALILFHHRGAEDIERFCTAVDSRGGSKDFLIDVIDALASDGVPPAVLRLLDRVDDPIAAMDRDSHTAEVYGIILEKRPDAADAMWERFLESTRPERVAVECLGELRAFGEYLGSVDEHNPLGMALALADAGFFDGDPRGSRWLSDLLQTGSAASMWLALFAADHGDRSLPTATRLLLGDSPLDKAVAREADGLVCSRLADIAECLRLRRATLPRAKGAFACAR